MIKGPCRRHVMNIKANEELRRSVMFYINVVYFNNLPTKQLHRFEQQKKTLALNQSNIQVTPGDSGT